MVRYLNSSKYRQVLKVIDELLELSDGDQDFTSDRGFYLVQKAQVQHALGLYRDELKTLREAREEIQGCDIRSFTGMSTGAPAYCSSILVMLCQTVGQSGVVSLGIKVEEVLSTARFAVEACPNHTVSWGALSLALDLAGFPYSKERIGAARKAYQLSDGSASEHAILVETLSGNIVYGWGQTRGPYRAPIWPGRTDARWYSLWRDALEVEREALALLKRLRSLPKQQLGGTQDIAIYHTALARVAFARCEWSRAVAIGRDAEAAGELNSICIEHVKQHERLMKHHINVIFPGKQCVEDLPPELQSLDPSAGRLWRQAFGAPVDIPKELMCKKEEDAGATDVSKIIGKGDESASKSAAAVGEEGGKEKETTKEEEKKAKKKKKKKMKKKKKKKN